MSESSSGRHGGGARRLRARRRAVRDRGGWIRPKRRGLSELAAAESAARRPRGSWASGGGGPPLRGFAKGASSRERNRLGGEETPKLSLEDTPGTGRGGQPLRNPVDPGRPGVGGVGGTGRRRRRQRRPRWGPPKSEAGSAAVRGLPESHHRTPPGEVLFRFPSADDPGARLTRSGWCGPMRAVEELDARRPVVREIPGGRLFVACFRTWGGSRGLPRGHRA